MMSHRFPSRPDGFHQKAYSYQLLPSVIRKGSVDEEYFIKNILMEANSTAHAPTPELCIKQRVAPKSIGASAG